jgi:hypothetical protein
MSLTLSEWSHTNLQKQIAGSLAKAETDLPRLYSYYVKNICHPVRARPKQVESESYSVLEENLPVFTEAGYNANNPWAAGYNALGYPWGQRGYIGGGGLAGNNEYLGGYMGDRVDTSFPHYE